jgi:hypothetical protein
MGEAEWTIEDDWIVLPALDSPTTITVSY